MKVYFKIKMNQTNKNPHILISSSNNLMYLVCDLFERNAVFFLVAATTTVTGRR